MKKETTKNVADKITQKLIRERIIIKTYRNATPTLKIYPTKIWCIYIYFTVAPIHVDRGTINFQTAENEFV